jgi:hypothetical protein
MSQKLGEEKRGRKDLGGEGEEKVVYRRREEKRK